MKVKRRSTKPLTESVKEPHPKQWHSFVLRVSGDFRARNLHNGPAPIESAIVAFHVWTDRYTSESILDRFEASQAFYYRKGERFIHVSENPAHSFCFCVTHTGEYAMGFDALRAA